MAYERYHTTLLAFAEHYGAPLDRTVAAFCALSPNSDYFGNLRSLASVLQGWSQNAPVDSITVSTYNHCKVRALRYLCGLRFDAPERGPKTLAFYHNIIDPQDGRWVTIDGHMVAAWRGEALTMKEARLGRSEYRTISHAIQQMAFDLFMVPCELQATIWFTRKRIGNVKYEPQMDLFGASDDKWKTLNSPETIRPYERKEIQA